MNTDPLFVFMVITHQNNFTKSPRWITAYAEYLECFPWIKTIVAFGGDEPNEEKMKTLPKYYQHIRVGDNYEDLPQKVISAVKYIYTNWPTVKGIFKIDDDVEIVNMPEFIDNGINLIASEIQYAGISTSVSNNSSSYHIGKCHDKLFNTPLPINPNIKYCGGPCYFLGANSIKLLATSSEYTINTIFEDNLIGYILNTYGNIKQVHSPLYYNLNSVIRKKYNNSIIAIHNAEHNNNLLAKYFSLYKLPLLPRYNKNQNLTEVVIDNELEVGNQLEIDDEIAFEKLDSMVPEKSINHRKNYRFLNYSGIMKNRMYYLLHESNKSNYITIIGGFCNNLFQITAAWYYQLAYGGNYIQCTRGNVNKSQISEEIFNYYQNYIFPKNNYPPSKIYKRPVFLNTIKACFDYIGDIYEPGKIIIHGDYFQNMKYIKTFNLDVIWRHILNINDTQSLFQKHSGVDWSKNDNFMSVHIRMGDYLNSQLHFIDFSAQIRKITTDILASDINKCVKFIFFSDSIDRLSNDIGKYIDIDNFKDRYIIINEKDPINTLRLVAACRRGHILSNSSFSLWGAILNPNKDKCVYLPRKWTTNAEGEDITSSFGDICKNTTFF